MKLLHCTHCKLGTILAIAGLLLLNLVPAAGAHAILIKSDPVADSTIKQLPEMITLTFDAPLIDAPNTQANNIIVTDPMRMKVTTSENVVAGSTLSNVLNPPMLMNGIYHVTFRVVSNDGHPATGDFIFRVDSNLNEPKNDPSPIAMNHHGLLQLSATATGSGVTDAEGYANGLAYGKFVLDFDHSEFCSQLTIKHLDEVLAIHIHPRDMKSLDVGDEIVLPVNLGAIGASQPKCVQVDSKSLNFVANNPSHYIMMLHTRLYPNGAVGGTLNVVGQEAPANVAKWSVATWVTIASLLAIALLWSIRRAPRKQ